MSWWKMWNPHSAAESPAGPHEGTHMMVNLVCATASSQRSLVHFLLIFSFGIQILGENWAILHIKMHRGIDKLGNKMSGFAS